MSEHAEKLKATLAELEQELHSLDSLDDETRNVLAQAARDIEAALQQEEFDRSEDDSLVARLGHAAQEFEGSHPTLTGIISRLIDGLGQMGI
jgi:ABC-type transporter Mla subunit MlaD